jgi:uncharacterized membrane protein
MPLSIGEAQYGKENTMASEKDTVVDLYIAAYSDPGAAQGDWDVIKQLAKDGAVDVDGLVLVSRGTDGKIKVKDDAKEARKGAVVGAVGGLVVGLIFPPSLLAAGVVGAGVGAGVGGLKSHREKKEIKAEVEDVLPPDSSGIVALFEERWMKDVNDALAHADKVTKHDVDKESADDVKAAASGSTSH